MSSECEELRKRLSTVETEKTQLEKKAQKSQQIIRKLHADLEEEKQMSKMFAEDKQTLITKNAELEKLRTTASISKHYSTNCFRRLRNWKSKLAIS